MQFGKEVSAECFANMEVIRAEFTPVQKYRYCPSWSAPNKAGRPKKNKRRRSVLEVAKGKRTKTTRPLTRFCQLCLKFNHHTVDCWVQEKNKEPETGRTLVQRPAKIRLPSTNCGGHTLRRTIEELPI